MCSHGNCLRVPCCVVRGWIEGQRLGVGNHNKYSIMSGGEEGERTCLDCIPWWGPGRDGADREGEDLLCCLRREQWSGGKGGGMAINSHNFLVEGLPHFIPA